MEKRETRSETYSLYEILFEDSEIVKEFKFYKPGFFLFKKIIRYLNVSIFFNRKDRTFSESKIITDYLKKERLITSFSLSGNLRNDLPLHHSVKFEHNEKIYGWCSQYCEHTGKAIAVALGELLERYFTSNENLSNKNYYLFKKSTPFVPLCHFNSYLKEQTDKFPQLLQLSQGDYKHTICTRIKNNKNYFIPSQYIFWMFHEENSKIVHQTTNGGGGYYDRDTAILSGVYELIQRDHFLLMWLSKERKRRIDIKTLPESNLLHLSRKVQDRGIDIHFIDTSRDIDVFSTVCVIIDTRNKSAYMGLGSSTGFNVIDCMETALKEALVALQTNLSTNSMFSFNDYKAFLNENIGRRERLSLWRNIDDLKKIDFLFSGEQISYQEIKKKEKIFKNKKDELKYIVEQLEEKGEEYSVYVYDVDSEILINLGYYVVKVIIPALIPIYLKEHYATLKSKRLAAVLGLQNTEDIKLERLNPFPHPFP